LNAGQFLTQVFTCTCEISYGKRNQTQKPTRLSPTPYRWAIRKCWIKTSGCGQLGTGKLFATYWAAGQLYIEDN